MDIKFHCDSEHNFKSKNQKVRAFLYTDYSIPSHNHEFYEMNIVLGGSGTHKIENASFSVSSGDVFVIPPDTVHAYCDTQNLDVYHILLHKKFISENRKEAEKIPGFLELIEIEPFLRQHFPEAYFLHLSTSQLMQLKTELVFIEEHGSFDKEEFSPLKTHTTLKILYWLSSLLFSQIHNKVKKSKYEQAIIKSLEFIHKNYNEKITIDDLCSMIFLSRSTFLRNFQNICGCTPSQYINKYRSKKARELMSNSQLSKTEIAHECGFYDLSHMEKILKAVL